MIKVNQTAKTLEEGVKNLMEGAKQDYVRCSTSDGRKELTGYSKEQVDKWDSLIKVSQGKKYIKVVRENGVFAFRLGEFLKAYTVSRDQKIDTLEAFGTVIVERMLDVVMVLLIFTILVPRLPFDDQYIKMGVFTFLGISLLTIIILMVAVKYQWLLRLDTMSLFSSDLGKRFLSYTTKLENGIKSLRRIKRPWEVILSSILIWGIYFLETLILIKSCKLPLNAYDAGIILFLGSISFGHYLLPFFTSKQGIFSKGPLP